MNPKPYLLAACLLTVVPVFGTPPLTEFPLGFTVHGESGGLYGDGKNDPPAGLGKRASAASLEIVPRNTSGKPSKDGSIGLLAIGMSNTSQKTAAWIKHLSTHPANPALVLVNGAIGGCDAADWADPARRQRQEQASPWDQMSTRLKASGLTSAQVQVVWLHQALRQPDRFGPFPAAADELAKDLTAITREAATRFPNLRLILISSRVYAGYAKSRLNPEPHAFESAISVRRVVLAARTGTPVILWGPYLWADGENARADGLKWESADFDPHDGTHLSPRGADKAAGLIDSFFRTSPFTRDWYPARHDP